MPGPEQINSQLPQDYPFGFTEKFLRTVVAPKILQSIQDGEDLLASSDLSPENREIVGTQLENNKQIYQEITTNPLAMPEILESKFYTILRKQPWGYFLSGTAVVPNWEND